LYILGSFFIKKEITRGRGGQLAREVGVVAKQIAKMVNWPLKDYHLGCPVALGKRIKMDLANSLMHLQSFE
jgi:hypothetical protein